MDRPVQESVLRRQRNLRILAAVGGVIVLALAVAGFRWLLRPELDRTRLRTGLAEQGTIEATITSSGTVVPSSEEIVPSPIASRVIAVHKRPGDAVEPGDLILELDTGQTKLELSNTEEEIALKRNDERTIALSMRNSLNDFQGQLELKQIDLESQEAKLARFKILERDGLVSGEQLLETELDVRRARVEIRQREQAIANLRESNEAELEKIRLETRILEQRLAEQQRTLDRASARAPRAGVLTSVILEEGTPVSVGDTLARIADLQSYRVDAELSDSYAPRLSEGQIARIKIGGRILNGRLQTILPEIQNGTMQLQLQLDDPRAEGLRANLRAEVYLVTDRREDVVTVPRGTSINGSGIKTVFVLNGERAERREIEVGLSSYDRWEILRGIEPGETLILSETERFEHMPFVTLKN